MALVMSPWFGRGCGRRARPFRFGSPSMFTDLVIVRVPGMMQMRSTGSCAPAAAGEPKTMSNARVVQWAETPDAHIFKLRLPGLKKEDLQIQVEDDRMLYINCTVSQVKKEETAGKPEGEAKDEQSKPRFMRKFKLPETADLEHIKAEVTNETLTVTVPKLKPKPKAGSEPRKIHITEAVSLAASAEKPSSAPTVDDVKPSTSTK